MRFGATRVRLCALVFASWLGLAPGDAAWAEVRIVSSTRYYNVRGTTMSEIWHELEAKGPVSTEGKQYHAETGSDIQWHIRYRMGSSCAVESVIVVVAIVYLMPKAVDMNRAAPEVQRRWRHFITALTAHEEGHGRNAIDAAHEIERAIANMSPRMTCDALLQNAYEIRDRALTNQYAMDRNYDHGTSHGLNQGTISP